MAEDTPDLDPMAKIEALKNAFFAKYESDRPAEHHQPVQPQRQHCSLCEELEPTLTMAPIVLATRCAEGRILFRQGESWCSGCASLVHGVDRYRHITLTPGAR